MEFKKIVTTLRNEGVAYVPDLGITLEVEGAWRVESVSAWMLHRGKPVFVWEAETLQELREALEETEQEQEQGFIFCDPESVPYIAAVGVEVYYTTSGMACAVGEKEDIQKAQAAIGYSHR